MFSQTELTTSQLPGAAATALRGQTASQSKRLLFLDNFRILLICGVLVVHLNVTYGWIGAWMYHDPAAPDLVTAMFLSILSGLGIACGMGFFFLLAGYFTPVSYERKGGTAFVRDRLIRLGIPWLVYALLLQPLVYYIAYGLPGSFWNFFLLYLHGVGSIADGPIWFVELLLGFSLLYAGWRWLVRARVQPASGTESAPSFWAILGFILGLGLVSFVVRLWWPASLQPKPFNLPLGYLPQYVSLYVVGIVAYRRNWLLALTSKMGRDWSLLALLATLLIFAGVVIPSVLQELGAAGTQRAGYALVGGFNWAAFGYALWESFVVVGLGIGLLALFRQRWNHQNKVTKEVAADVYTVYLIHPVVLVGFAYAFHVVALYPLLKWAIAILVTIPLCFLISSGVRRIPLVKQIL